MGTSDEITTGSQVIDAVDTGAIDRRRFLRRATALGLSFTVAQSMMAACGTSTSTPDRPTTVPATDTGGPTLTTARTSGGSAVKVRFMHGFQPGQPAGETMARLVNQFNAVQSAVVVEHVPTPPSRLGEDVAGQLAAGTPPDLAWGGLPVKAIDDGQVVPVDSDGRGGQAFDLSRFDAGWLDLLKYRGKIWALPFELSAVSIGVNRDLFERAGVPLPSYGWRWEEMLDIAKRLTKPGEHWGWANTRPAWQWWDALKSAGGALVTTGKPTRCALDSEAAVRGAATYGELWTKHQVASTAAPVDEFNRTGLFALWPTCVAVPSYAAALPFKASATTVPIIKDKAAQWCYKVLTMYKTTAERQEATARFIQWFYQDETFLEWALGSGTLPLTKAQRAHPKWRDRVRADPGWEAPMYQLENGYLFAIPPVPAIDGYYQHLQRATDAIATGRTAPATALAEAAQQINALIDQGQCIGCER